MGGSGGILGALIGSIAGAVLGNHVGIAGFGNAINGSVPCAITGGLIGALVGDKIDTSSNKAKFPKEGTRAPLVNESVRKIELDIANSVVHFRKANGRSATKLNNDFSTVARYKSQDMKNAGLVSVDSPTYGDLSNMMNGFGVAFSEIGMCVGAGYKCAGFSIWDWMNSSKIKSIILNEKYEEIGVGYVESEDGGYMTIIFLKK